MVKALLDLTLFIYSITILLDSLEELSFCYFDGKFNTNPEFLKALFGFIYDISKEKGWTFHETFQRGYTISFQWKQLFPTRTIILNMEAPQRATQISCGWLHSSF